MNEIACLLYNQSCRTNDVLKELTKKYCETKKKKESTILKIVNFLHDVTTCSFLNCDVNYTFDQKSGQDRDFPNYLFQGYNVCFGIFQWYSDTSMYNREIPCCEQRFSFSIGKVHIYLALQTFFDTSWIVSDTKNDLNQRL